MDSFLPAVRAGLQQSQAGLSGFTGADVKVEGTRVELMPVLDMAGLTGPKDQVVVGIYVGFEGSITGHGLLMFDQESAAWLVEQIVGSRVEGPVSSDSLARSALLELGNITISGFLNGLADWFNMTVLPTTPHIAFDIMAAILNSVLASVSVSAENAVSIETTFSFPSKDSVSGYLLLLPDHASLQTLFTQTERSKGECSAEFLTRQ